MVAHPKRPGPPTFPGSLPFGVPVEDAYNPSSPYYVNEFDNELVVGDVLFNTSNSYAGVDFEITCYVPVDHERQKQLLHDMTYRAEVARIDGNAELQRYYMEKIQTLGKGAYIEKLLEITDLSIASRRSIPAVRNIGEASPIYHAKGVRTFAGSLVMALLKRDPLLELYRVDDGDPFDNSPFHVDRIPPFHISLVATNEYGHSISSVIMNVVIGDFQGVVSVNDMYTEFAYTYKATSMTPFVHNDVRNNLKEFLRKSRMEENNIGTPSTSMGPYYDETWL